MKPVRLLSFFAAISLFTMAPAVADTVDKDLASQIAGGWEGSLAIDEDKSQGIVWRFDLSEAGDLSGFMGPVQAGAVLPMSEIVLAAGQLSFTLEGQGTFQGQLSKATSEEGAAMIAHRDLQRRGRGHGRTRTICPSHDPATLSREDSSRISWTRPNLARHRAELDRRPSHR